MFDRSGVVQAVKVEAVPDGRIGYGLRLIPEARPVADTTQVPLGTLVQLVTRLADLVAQGQELGMVLRDSTTAAPATAGRTEVAVLGSLIQTIVAESPRFLPPLLDAIIQRAGDPSAPDRYASVNELRGDLAKLFRTLPAPASGATVALSRVAQVVGALETPNLVAVTGLVTLPDGQTGYGLRVGPDGGTPTLLATGSADEVVTLMLRLVDAVGQGRTAGMVLREVATGSVTLTLSGADARAEVTALGTVFRDLLVLTQTPIAAPLAAVIQRALEPEVEERYDTTEALRDDLAQQHQLARLLPGPITKQTAAALKPRAVWVVWLAFVGGVLLVGVLLFG